MKRSAAIARSLGAMGIVIAGGACSDSATVVHEDGGIAGLDPEQALFAAPVTQFLPDSSTSGLLTLDDPALPGLVTLDEAIELAGTAAIFGSERAGYLVVGNSDGPTLTRYDLGAGNTLIPGPSLSIGGFGLTSGFRRPGLVPILSNDKAYFLDDSSLQGIVWNPADMTVTSSFSLEEAEPVAERSLEFGENAVLRGELLYVPANYRTGDDGEAGTALVVIIDTRTDRLLKVVEDDRCGNTLHAVLHDDGSIYVATGTIGASFHAIGFPENYPEPCLLRIPPGETEFDPEFHRSLVELAGGRPAGRLIRGRGGYFYVSVLLEEELEQPIGSTDNIFAEWEATAWRLFRFRLDGDEPATPMGELPLSGGGGRVLFADGIEYVQQVQDNGARTTLYVPQDDGTFSKGVELPGIP